MKKFSWKKLLSLVLVAALVIGTFRVSGKQVKAATSNINTAVDLLDITVFDFEQDEDDNGNGNDANFRFLQNGSHYPNVWQEFRRTVGLAEWTDSGLKIVGQGMNNNGNGRQTTKQNGSTSTPFNNNSKNEKGTYTLILNPDPSGYYSFNSKTQTMSFSVNETTAIATEPVEGANYEFMPLGSSNYYFGLSFEKKFFLPIDRKLTDAQGNQQDIIFEFSGDDDVWVVIDDIAQPVLDLGGIHGAIKGVINITTGDVTYKYVGGKEGNQNNDSTNYKTGDEYIGQNEQQKKLAYVDCSTERTDTVEALKNLTPGKLHTLRFFYLERGAGNSNCKFSYNLPNAVYTINHVFEKPDGTFEIPSSGEYAPIEVVGSCDHQITNDEVRVACGDLWDVTGYTTGDVYDANGYINYNSGYQSATTVSDGAMVYVHHMLKETSYGVRYFTKDLNGNQTLIDNATYEKTIKFQSTITLDEAFASFSSENLTLGLDSYKPAQHYSSGVCTDEDNTLELKPASLDSVDNTVYFDIVYTELGKYTVNVHYVDIDSENKIADSFTKTLYVDENYDCSEAKKDTITIGSKSYKYVPEGSNSLTGNARTDGTDVNLYLYYKYEEPQNEPDPVMYTVTIHYVDENETELADTVSKTFNAGDDYDCTDCYKASIEKDGKKYKYVSGKEELEGESIGNNIDVYLVYKYEEPTVTPNPTPDPDPEPTPDAKTPYTVTVHYIDNWTEQEIAAVTTHEVPAGQERDCSDDKKEEIKFEGFKYKFDYCNNYIATEENNNIYICYQRYVTVTYYEDNEKDSIISFDVPYGTLFTVGNDENGEEVDKPEKADITAPSIEGWSEEDWKNKENKENSTNDEEHSEGTVSVISSTALADILNAASVGFASGAETADSAVSAGDSAMIGDATESAGAANTEGVTGATESASSQPETTGTSEISDTEEAIYKYTFEFDQWSVKTEDPDAFGDEEDNSPLQKTANLLPGGLTPSRYKGMGNQKGRLIRNLNLYPLFTPSRTPVKPTPTPDPTGTPTPSPDPTGTPSPSPDPTGTPSPSPDPTGTPAPSPDPTGTPSPEPTPGNDPEPTPSGDPAPSPDPDDDPIIPIGPTPEPSPEPTPEPTPDPVDPVIPDEDPVVPDEEPVPEEEIIDDLDFETPQGAPEEEPEEEPEEVLDLVEDITPQGGLPQTGALDAGIFYGLGTACIAFGATLVAKLRRKDEE